MDSRYVSARNGLVLPASVFEGVPGNTIRRDPATDGGRYAPCPCGSGKKFRKCCGKPHRPARPRDEEVVDDPEPDRTPTVLAMRKYGIPEASIHAYLQVGVLVTDENRQIHEPELAEAFDAAAAEFLANAGASSAPL